LALLPERLENNFHGGEKSFRSTEIANFIAMKSFSFYVIHFREAPRNSTFAAIIDGAESHVFTR
jgi:hypothetical protein